MNAWPPSFFRERCHWWRFLPLDPCGCSEETLWWTTRGQSCPTWCSLGVSTVPTGNRYLRSVLLLFYQCSQWNTFLGLKKNLKTFSAHCNLRPLQENGWFQSLDQQGIPKWNIFKKISWLPHAYLSTDLSKDFYLSFLFEQSLVRYIIKVLQECSVGFWWTLIWMRGRGEGPY